MLVQASRVNMTALQVSISTGAIVDVSGRGSTTGEGAGVDGAGGSFGGSGGLSGCGDSSAPFYAADGVVGDIDVWYSKLVGSGGDRKSVVWGKSVSVLFAFGGLRCIITKNKT